MSESMQMWMEISFNVAYLIAVWGLVIAMKQRLDQVPGTERRLAQLFLWAFALLALGDTGHVGFRVLAYAQGDLESTLTVSGIQIGLVGAGALATAITVTFFYILMLAIWRQRFNKPYGWFEYLLLAVSAVRFVIMLFPANEWNNTVPEQPWSLYRNLPLMVLGLGAAYLILRDARAAHDRTFTWIGAMIVTSYAFYTPVIFFVQKIPMLGMLMIPKTVAYVVIAVIAYADLFQAKASIQQEASQLSP